MHTAILLVGLSMALGTAITTPYQVAPNPPVHLVADVNDDPGDDVVVLSGTTRQVLEGDIVGLDFASATWGSLSPATGWAKHVVGDFNGDAEEDTAGFLTTDGSWRVSISNSDQFLTAIWADFSPNTGWGAQLAGDFNGDLRSDIANYYPANGTWWVARSTGSAFSTTLWADFSSTNWARHLVGDFNGDGKDDIASYSNVNGTWWVSRANTAGTGFSTSLWADYSTASGWTTQIVGDFNGDDMDDIANYYPQNGTWWVSRSTGTGFVTSMWADFSTASGWTTQVVGYFNGDDLADIANYYPGNGTWWVSRANAAGTGFLTSMWADFSTASGWTTQAVGDFNADDLSDIVNYHAPSNTWSVSRSTGAAFATARWFP